MNNKVLIIVRHHSSRKRLLLRAIKTIENQTHKDYIYALLPMDYDTHHELNYYDFIQHDQGKFFGIINTQESVLSFLEFNKSAFVCFLDDDDTWAPEYLSRLISILKTKDSYPSVKAVASHSNKVTEVMEGNRIIVNRTEPLNHYLSTGPLEFDFIQYRNSLPVSSCLFEFDSLKKIIKNHDPFKPGFFWPLLIDYISQYDIWLIPEALSFYHFRENSDHIHGNYSLINYEQYEIYNRLKINELMRHTKNNKLLILLISNLINKTNFHRIANINDKVDRL